MIHATSDPIFSSDHRVAPLERLRASDGGEPSNVAGLSRTGQ